MRRSLLFAVLIAPLTACATLSNTARSYITAPNGLQIDDDRVRSLLRNARADSALRAVSNRKSTLSPDDRLLRLLYQGSTARYSGHNREAGAFFDQAFAVSEDRFTKSISQTAASLVTNDYALPYTAGQNERLMLHYNALLAWSADGDTDAAAVEARRMVALLASIGDGDEQERPHQLGWRPGITGGDLRFQRFSTIHQRIHRAQKLVVRHHFGHPRNDRGLQPVEAAELGVWCAQSIENHGAHQGFGIELSLRRAQRARNRVAKAQAHPKFVQGIHITKSKRLLELGQHSRCRHSCRRRRSRRYWQTHCAL